MNTRHFLTLNDLSREELRNVVTRAMEMKNNLKAGKPDVTKPGKTLCMILKSHLPGREFRLKQP